MQRMLGRFDFTPLFTLALIVVSCGIPAEERESAALMPADIADSAIAAAFERWGNPQRYSEASCDSSELIAEVVAGALSDSLTRGSSLSRSGRFLRIVDSDDSAVRVVWWVSPCSGSWRQFTAVAAVRSRDGGYGVSIIPGRITEEAVGMEFSLGAVSTIYSLGDSLYLVHGAGQLSGSMPYEFIIPVIFRPDTVMPADLSFHFTDQTTAGITLDTYHYLDSLDRYSQRLPQIIRFDSSALTITLPTLRTSGGERIVDEVYGGGLTMELESQIRLRFKETAFVEVE